MRLFFSILVILFTVALCYILDSRSVLPAPLGKLLSPQHGVWQNAEAANTDFSGTFSFPELKGEAEVFFDERLVPHIFASQTNDAYFVQGYLHAKFRLWQMELQCLAAAGRASEVIGEKALDHDREFRRLGMVYAAEKALKMMEADPEIKSGCDAYTAGVNRYIETLTESSLPLEYKIIGYKPEKWSNLKSALFLKYMSYDLAGHENDFELSNARRFFSPETFKLLFPAFPDSIDPVIPSGTIYDTPSIRLQSPVVLDSVKFDEPSFTFKELNKPDPANGSNNWALSGSKTLSGSPILCNDPHLGLNLPSLWFEMQISTPDYNVYGVSFPGAPSVIIGFNDSCSWGVTNGGRDVRDYYKITFRDESRSEYRFDSAWLKTSFRYERIKVAGRADFIDTVAYTVFGPVMYDNNFGLKRNSSGHSYAVRWKAHDESNELKTFHLLNRARNYTDYLDAVKGFQTPGQNFVFAAKSGDIALRTQGSFPAKWKEQGDYVMPGEDSSFLWRGIIPFNEVPYQYNPERGFVSSANQLPADSAYPYYLGRDYETMRGRIVNRMLAAMNGVTPTDMMKMQTSNYNLFAEMARPALIRYFQENKFTPDELKYWNLFTQWNLNNDVNSTGATVFTIMWKEFFNTVYSDEYEKAPQPIVFPLQSTLLESLLRDSISRFTDDINTAAVENWYDVTNAAYKKALPLLIKAEKEGKLEWAKFKDTKVQHLSKLEAFSRLHLPIGGGRFIINATRQDHGPSWRMIVHLTKETEAYGVFPGGQSGNPGSRFYDNFINTWAMGKYFKLWMMKREEQNSGKIIAKMKFN